MMSQSGNKRLSLLNGHFHSQKTATKQPFVSGKSVGDSTRQYPEIVDHHPERGVYMTTSFSIFMILTYYDID
jgi:hypothetical protein